ncbi:DUF7793 family protein [Confluentibacter lentus]|uniref:DUF7793 family protein n=1 Tax=Confluentibacter lentus TaxID=1699412 RepID=UPI000C28D5F1|nr:hypothetical protein [Confluentibacter lentus]
MITDKRIIIINKTRFWTDSRGILFCEFQNKGTYLTLEVDAIEKYEKAISELSQGNPMPFLIDVRDVQSNFSIETAKLFANNVVFKKIRISEAYVINSINTKLLINTYKRIYEPTTPFKIFKDYDEALEYLIKVKKTLDGGI